MHHFFVEPKNIVDEQIRITGSDVRHITKALRLQPDDKISVADGQGQKYIIKIVETSEEVVIGEIQDEFVAQVEPEVKVTLLQGLPKSKKMDLIVQKCTELGIDQVIPMETKRSVVKLKPSKAKRRQKRWQKIAEEAAKQSGRATIPKVGELKDFIDLEEIITDYDLVLIPWEDEDSDGLKNNLQNLDLNPEKILLVIGPEGGFASEEVDKAKELGAKSVTLGPRILRTETAGLAALSMILYEAGDLGGA
ncbi:MULTISPECIES: 16S rRNA (uracil(1498)-N(3))-methyltransferase [unclassified Candidatus Frackibacter]|uniref:16S rRNA (uracil(1498)-N(3))-methyltransferase n=1 Tax=unclassified Candidatus Frackibacter TaxID=2648818 RepID=UPI0008830187|nr:MULTISPECIES: 16S rRNA (uracil(1498)-N(3))-methyltransferase [unclassified Candidatus Frackibacter]SDC73830.1 16S rRNA (uracil1498-N3)-methyltransferase [Candidatus Frackibacter sp. WG11]SEM87911.1 16S rRNA (uracil1498-N3)-methyltransferase [Candidatus Frackibacter sp. WG12]SFL97190.1 16S rRNA (uracil1498-N3)-methyltransferase [Candidatus Frackibacter sp. WG13]